ncbi:hypothetical protein [Nocardia sp. CDC160]|uniref:hypothetical protein n=1 Tax=Nocardia sp. CDC160 TaxID=3112166 RepID=UPI002DBCF4A6|nr:hypothetical protein [Nocardia sp. CDC160]MEC3917892.1 hypothetical protein [Nocardia sp. CDC160]
MQNPLGDNGSRRLHVVDSERDESPRPVVPPLASPPEIAAFHGLIMGPRLPRPPLVGALAPSAPQLARAWLHRVEAAHGGKPIRLPTLDGTVVLPCTVDTAEELSTAVLDASPRSLKIAVGDDGSRRYLQACPPYDIGWTAARETVRAVAAAEVDRLLRRRHFDDRIPFQHGVAAWERLCRRIVLGDRAGLDTLLHREIRARIQAPLTALERAEQSLTARIAPYLQDPEPDTIAAIACTELGTAAACEVVAHLLLNLSGTLERGGRALALWAMTHAAPRAVVSESRRLWPGWSHLVYVAAAPFRWRGYEFGFGETIQVPVAWLLRDGRVFAAPDGFSIDPGLRRRADAFAAARVCGGTARCFVDDLVSEALSAFLTAITDHTVPTLIAPRGLAASRLPARLPVDRIRLRFIARGDLPRDVDVLAFETGSVGDLVFKGDTPQRYGDLAAASAARLRAHAQRLRDCADGADLAADRFYDVRVVLFEQAERCQRAAEDVEQAAAGLRAVASQGIE